MKKWSKLLIIGIGLVLAGFIIYMIVKQSLREENFLYFPETIEVQNATEYKLDTIVKALVHNVFGYDTINIGVAYMPKMFEHIGDIEYKAAIQKNIFQDHTYLILVSSKLRVSEYMVVMAHEIIHLHQYEIGDLVQIDLGLEMVVYKGDTIKLKEVFYNDRSYEIDAFEQEDVIYSELEKVLYK